MRLVCYVTLIDIDLTEVVGGIESTAGNATLGSFIHDQKR